MANHFDIVIIGSGAGGATLAQRLAPTGKSILILERGDQRIVTVRDLKSHEIWGVLDGKFPE